MSTKVRVYKNLLKGCLSVQEKIDGRWLVVEYVDRITIKGPRFLVTESGRQRAIREQQRNVHARIEGIGVRYRRVPKKAIHVSYDPYYLPYFFLSDTREPAEVGEFSYLTINESGMWGF